MENKKYNMLKLQLRTAETKGEEEEIKILIDKIRKKHLTSQKKRGISKKSKFAQKPIKQEVKKRCFLRTNEENSLFSHDTPQAYKSEFLRLLVNSIIIYFVRCRAKITQISKDTRKKLSEIKKKSIFASKRGLNLW